MRIIFFNIWHGKILEGIKQFISDESGKTDIFCLLEIGPQIFSDLKTVLPGYDGHILYAGDKPDDMGELPGQAVFVKKGLEVTNLTKKIIYKISFHDSAFLEFFDLKAGTHTIHIANVHGKAKPGTKMDTPVRIRQSQTIIDYFKDKKGPVIIGGDFNLMPNTKSIKMFEEAGFKNLIRDFEIKNTRNKLSWEQFNNVQYFADYCFVTSDIKVKNFEVPQLEISDHEPLILDFEI